MKQAFLRLKDSEHERVKIQAEKEERTAASLMRIAIRKYLDEAQANESKKH